MGPKFFQTIMGQRFFEGTVPAILGQIKRLNKNLERLNERGPARGIHRPFVLTKEEKEVGE